MIRMLLLLFPSFAYASSDSDTGTACCGVVVFILIVIAIKESIVRNGGRLKNQGHQPEEPSTIASSPQIVPPTPFDNRTRLHIAVLPGEKDMGAGNMSCLTVMLNGLIELPPTTLTAVFSLSMWDISLGEEEDKRKPVMCSIPELQMTGTQVFFWTHVLQLPHHQSFMQNWTEIVSIPIDLLTFPAKGRRKLHFHISIAPLGQAQSPTSGATFIYEHMNTSLGYIDGIKIRIKAEELGLKYAAAVSAVDGEIDSDEKIVIRNWMDTRIDSLPEDMRGETTRSLSRALMIAERLSASIKPDDIELLCDDIAAEYPIGSFPKGELFDIVELCMKVAAADGIANPEELKLVDRIASLLGVDRERVKKMSEKILPVNMHSEKDIDSILGLQPGWTSKQKKKHLREQYREWSARVTHSDVKVRDQADEMLRIIAEERAKIDAEQ